MVAHAESQRVGRVLELDVHCRARCVSADVRERLLQDPVGAQVDAGRQRRDRALERERHGSPRAAGRLHELVQAGEARLRISRRLAVRVLAENAQQPAHLGERVARRLTNRLEVGATLVWKSFGREAGALGLDRDCRHVVSDDVVEVARDPGALAHRRLVLQRIDHRLARLVALRDDLAALPARVAERQSRNHDHQQQHAGEPGTGAVERLDRVREEREHGEHRPAPAVGEREQIENADESDEGGDRERALLCRQREEDAEDDRARRPSDVPSRERQRERRQQVRDHRLCDRIRVDRDLGHRDEREPESERQRPVGPGEDAARVLGGPGREVGELVDRIPRGRAHGAIVASESPIRVVRDGEIARPPRG